MQEEGGASCPARERENVMKKVTSILATVALAFAVVGCGSQPSGIVSSDGSEGMAEETPEVTVIQGEVAWSVSEDAAAAAEAAGFSSEFVVPYPLPIGEHEWSQPSFTAMDHVAQADYDGGGICASIRKGEGVAIEDLSADLNDYLYEWTQECDGIVVSCYGYEDGIANFLEWEVDGCSYDVWCVSTEGGNLGMNADEVYAMVTSIK